jgi:hypothetical protein
MNFDLFVCVMVQTKGSLSRGSDFFKKKKLIPLCVCVCACVMLQTKGSL